MDDTLADLNPPQREAVLHETGPLLVLAGAGSGKTRVITHRIAHLVTRLQVAPWRILAVTFTNKAAGEMRQRLTALLGAAGEGLTVSTFHSAAAMLLRREVHTLHLSRHFLIYDEGQQLSLVRRAMREVGIDVSASNPRGILARIDVEKNAGRLPQEIQPTDNTGLEMTYRVYRKYQQLLRAADAVDFGDLLLLLVELLKTNEAVRARYQQRFQHILVDEFQDTNPVQYTLLQLLAPPPEANVVVVGDDDQSIYRWRGAEVDNILSFSKVYPACRTVKLEQNYRSTQTILDAAHAVISQNPLRMHKKLWTARDKGTPVSLVLAADERSEAQEVAARILTLCRDGICTFDGIAVFFRTNAQSRVLEEAFRLMHVPYVLVSGRSFYALAEIRDALSYLRLMVNVKSDADVLRIINTPPRAIGQTTVERLTRFATETGVSLFEAIAVPDSIPGLGSAPVKRLKSFRRLLDMLVAGAQEATTAHAACCHMLEYTGLVATHMQEGSDEALGRAENLKELLSATREFDRQRTETAPAAPPATVETTRPSPPQKDLFPTLTPRALAEGETVALESFLQHLALISEGDGATGMGQGRVSLMTLHAAKGLEFDVVFMTGMEEDVFPHRRASNFNAAEEDMSEERRLCYVGFTRARHRLFATLAQSRSMFGELRFNLPSRFLSETPPALWDVPLQAAPHAAVRPRPHLPYSEGRQKQGPTLDTSAAFSQCAEGEVCGQAVQHRQFGRGVVVNVSGSGPTAKLTVRFDSCGLKTVIARFLAPL